MSAYTGAAYAGDGYESSPRQYRPRQVPDGLLTQEEAAMRLGCSKNHLANRLKDLASVRVGSRVFYRPADLDAFKANRPPRTASRNGTFYHRRAQSYGGDVERLERIAFEIAEDQAPMTVRQMFYQMTVRNLVPKDDRGYDQVVNILRDMRDAAYDPKVRTSVVMPIDWVVDNSRRNEERQHFQNPETALDWVARIYRKDFWHDADERVLVVVEKDALAGTLYEVTAPYDVPVIVPRGYSSISYVARLVEDMEGWSDQPVFIYYFADFDPSGQDAARAFEDRLRMMLPSDYDFIVEEAAITPEQIRQYDLWAAGRDTKRTDSRAAGFFAEHGAGAKSYELDALPPKVLRQIVLDCIREHVPDELHQERLAAERRDRERIVALVEGDPTDFAWGP